MVLLNKGVQSDERSIVASAMIGVNSTAFVTGQSHGQEPPPVLMVDELLILSPHKLSFSEASLRVMITPHFSPRTRLSMAGRVLISEVFHTA